MRPIGEPLRIGIEKENRNRQRRKLQRQRIQLPRGNEKHHDGEERPRQRKRQRKHGVLKLDHFQNSAYSSGHSTNSPPLWMRRCPSTETFFPAAARLAPTRGKRTESPGHQWFSACGKTKAPRA